MHHAGTNKKPQKQKNPLKGHVRIPRGGLSSRQFVY
jgi:hypothetical protein